MSAQLIYHIWNVREWEPDSALNEDSDFSTKCHTRSHGYQYAHTANTNKVEKQIRRNYYGLLQEAKSSCPNFQNYVECCRQRFSEIFNYNLRYTLNGTPG